MRLLFVNNFSHLKGGAEISFLNTGRLLEKNRHQIFYFFADKKLEKKKKKENNLKKTLNTLYSFEAKEKLGQVLERIKPDIVHLNNIYHHLSPAIIDEIKKRKIPVVLTLRDYKLVCALYKLWRKGKICEECKNKNFRSILKNQCSLKGNFGESFLLYFEMILHHRVLHLYDKVDVFTAPSRFLIKKFKELGFSEKIEYLPNFVFLDEYKPSLTEKERSIVYLGRLVPEKGLDILIETVRDLPVKLKIIGKGKLESKLKKYVLKEKIENIQFLGWLGQDDLKKEVAKSMFTLLPSVWYENNPRSIIESFALGKPVISSKIGGIPELVKDRFNGLLFSPGSASELRKKIIWLVKNKDLRKKMGKRGRKLVEKQYNEKKCYKDLIAIYHKLLR